ncbi:MAG: PilZ domain-containing protein [Acidobacteria bacterium]|nr:PilZ domain-containing protein [Acidobacteriota bacterium]
MADTRRTSRIALCIPVEVSGLDATGAHATERANTATLSRHGAYLVLQHKFSEGSDVCLAIPHLERKQRCRVVWVRSAFGDSGPYETGVELDSAENFWGVQFPPEDWVAPKHAPLAGTQPRPMPSSIVGDHEQQLLTLTAMLQALISVLEHKRVVTPAELADMLRRNS